MEVWFSNLDLKNAYSQYNYVQTLANNASIVGGETTGTYRFLAGFYGLGDMPNEFQRVIDSLLKDIPFTNCYIDDILIASKGSLNEHKAILTKILNILDNKNMAVKCEKCAFFQKAIEWLGFKISNSGVKPLVGNSDSIKSLPNPKNISKLRSFFGSINQYMKFVPNLLTLSCPLRPRDGENWLTIALASRFLNSHETKYSTNELELLGVVWATEHFTCMALSLKS